MTKQRLYLLALPTMAVMIGAAILLYGSWSRGEVEDEVEALFQAHVESVALLIQEGTREAAASTSLIYELTEARLLSAAELLSTAQTADKEPLQQLPNGPWPVQLIFSDDVPPAGLWGPIPEDVRDRFIEQIFRAEPRQLIDGGLVSDLELVCLYRDRETDLFLVCQNAENLNALQARTGIGPLLRGVTKENVLFVALQDATGILAVAPSTTWLTGWREDPMLETSLGVESHKGLSRLRTIDGNAIFEGLIPFEMADESKVVLRIGIHASQLLEIRENLQHRYNIMLFLVIGVVLLTGLLTWFFWRWQARETEMQRQLAKRAEQQQHWQTVGQMAATVAHEVRNPLNTVAMVSQRLQNEFTMAEEERADFNELVGLLISESERVGQVVREFLALGAPLNLQLERVDVENCLTAVLLPIRLRAEEEGKSLEVIHRGEGRFVVDEKRFGQMVTNLVENALDAVPRGGDVFVRSRCSDIGLQVEVVDNGTGLTEDEVQNVVRPFVSLKASGTGLGLPLVKRYAEAHGGEFDMESTPGEGTTARIFIPGKEGLG